MTPRQYTIALVVLTLSGLIGGAAANQLFSGVANAETIKSLKVRELVLTDDNNRTRAVLALAKDSEPYFSLHDKNGKGRVVLALTADGEPAFTLHDSNEVVRTAILLASENPLISFSDENGKLRAALGHKPNGKATLEFKNSDGALLWKAP